MRFDPENIEPRLLKDYAGAFQGKRVLEIGSGAGRLTWLYAREAQKVVGVDPSPEKTARAKEEMPSELVGRVSFEQYPFEAYQSDELFDLAILSWSL